MAFNTTTGGFTTAGLAHWMNTQVHGGTAVSPWYLLLIRDDNIATPPFAAADTLPSHAGWEEGDEYSGNRKEFVEAASTTGSTSNTASPADFVVNLPGDTQTFVGYALVSAATGTTGTLLGEATFSGGSQAAVKGDTIRLTVTLTVAS